MNTRKIIKIDEEKCNGCGLCAKACAEGAIEIIGGKAKLVSETYCDGLGACLGKCPVDAIIIEDRSAAAFDPEAVHRHLTKRQASAEPKHGQKLPCGCPGTLSRKLSPQCESSGDPDHNGDSQIPASRLGNWPVQLNLVPPHAPYFAGARLLISADCVPFAFAGFHQRLLGGRVLLVGCPKLDDADFYREKLVEIFRQNDIRSIDVAYMEVPCCFGLLHLVSQALAESGKDIPLKAVKIAIKGNIIQEEELTSNSHR